MSTGTTAAVPSDVVESWRPLMVAGAIVAVLGVVAIFTPFLTGIALSIVLGALLVVGALVHAANAFSARGWTGALGQVVLAVLYAFAGIALLANPVLGLATLTVVLVAYFVVEGVVEVVMGIQARPDAQWGWLVASGVVSVLLAGLLWAGFPSTARWAVGLLFGVNLLSTGVSLLFVANVGRKAASPGGDLLGTQSRGL